MFRKFIIIAIASILASSTNAQSWLEIAQNQNNPYDSIGYYHNYAIQQCMSNSKPIECANNYIAYLFPNDIPEIIDEEKIEEINSLASWAALNDSTFYVPEFLSEEAQGYTTQLINMIDEMEESNEINDVVSGIVDLEDQILQSTTLTEEDQTSLLCAASVARYSLYFWLENVDSTEEGPIAISSNFLNYAMENSISNFDFSHTKAPNLSLSIERNFISIYNSDHELLPYKPGWFRRLLHVVVGDIVGTLVGAGLGTLVPGCTSPCILLGAILGGMSGSLAAADSENML